MEKYIDKKADEIVAEWNKEDELINLKGGYIGSINADEEKWEKEFYKIWNENVSDLSDESYKAVEQFISSLLLERDKEIEAIIGIYETDNKLKIETISMLRNKLKQR